MRKKIVFLLLALLCCVCGGAQEPQKSDLQQRAESEDAKGNIATARYLFIRAFDEYTGKGQMAAAVQCATKATALYYKENFYKEAFDLLRRADQAIDANAGGGAASALHYQTARERMQMYMKLRKGASVQEQLALMERHAGASGDEALAGDLLYNKAIYYYTFGQNERGNAVFKEMAAKLTANGDYDRVDQVYRTLIDNGRRSGSAGLVAQAYGNYMVWKDSVTELRHVAQTDSLNRRIAANEAAIAERDGSLSTRKMVIWGLCVLAAALAVALVLGALVLMRFIVVNRKQKNTIHQLNDDNAQKARFISNVAAQLNPTLQRLDARIPEVQALLGFSSHVQTLSELESADALGQELEEVQVLPFCEALIGEIRPKVKSGVELMVKAPKMSARINKEYVTHILRHLLDNAAVYTPEGGHITIDFKKRSAHTQQFQVLDTGSGIPEEMRDSVFRPFGEPRDLTEGDGLGLPICRLMAQKMGGDLSIDPTFTKGTRFLLDLHT